MQYHETGLVHNKEYKIYRMCHKTKQEIINGIMHFTRVIFKENIIDVEPPPKPNLF